MKRPANGAGVVESAEPRQPPLIFLLDASKICPLLRKAGNFPAKLLRFTGMRNAGILGMTVLGLFDRQRVTSFSNYLSGC